MTGIEWTDKTHNCVYGCRRKSPGCNGCYAVPVSWIRSSHPNENIAARFADLVSKDDGKLDWTGKVFFSREALYGLLDIPGSKRIFINSVSDLGYAPVEDAWIAEIFAVMSLRPQHAFQLLTKRPERFVTLFADPEFVALVEKFRSPHAVFDDGPLVWPLPNVWMGTSVENQKYADQRVPLLKKVPARVRFLSVEPLVGPVDLSEHLGLEYSEIGGCWIQELFAELRGDRHGIDWIITGGETGPTARPAPAEWFATIQDQCAAAEIPYFHKQNGVWAPGRRPEGSRRRECLVSATTGRWVERTAGDEWRAALDALEGDNEERWTPMYRAGRETAGKHLNGRLHLAMPHAWKGGEAHTE